MPLVADGVLRASRSDTRVWERTALTWAVMPTLAAAAVPAMEEHGAPPPAP